MTEEQARKLAGLKNYHTRYEVEVVRKADGAKRLLCYTPRKSKRGLILAIGERAEHVKAFLGIGQGASGGFAGQEYVLFPNIASIRFSGRTQRDAILGGELGYVAQDQ